MTPRPILIYCDDPSHDSRKAVTNFAPADPFEHDGRWNEHYTSTAAQGRRESGQTIKGDETRWRSGVDEVMETQGPFRSRYSLACRKCKSRPVIAREENLFSALNRLAERGVMAASLRLIAAILGEQSDSK